MPTDENQDKSEVGSTLKNEERETGRREQEKDLVTWTAPGRPFKRRNKEFWVTLIAIAAVSGLVLFLAEGFMPVILVISVVFLFYVLSTVEPEKVEHKITNKGIKVAGRLTNWDVMGRYWFAKRFDAELLVVELGILPGRLELVITSDKKEEIKKALSEYLVHEEVPASGIDRATDWFSQKMPGR